MLIDKYEDHWLDRLNAQADRAENNSRTFLLIDGVFIPGFYRQVNAVLPTPSVATLLFESLPSCSEATRAVSPFIAPYSSSNRRLQTLLAQCSGWPMVSAVETSENQAELTARLAAWCVVAADQSRFNLRFPDTRRLAQIFEVLTAKQQLELSGPARRWSYVDRFGSWAELVVAGMPSSVVERPELDDKQFAQLVNASEVDEVVSILMYRGIRVTGRLSQTYTTASLALRAAKDAGLDSALHVDWCEGCLAKGVAENGSETTARLAEWTSSRQFSEEASP